MKRALKGAVWGWGMALGFRLPPPGVAPVRTLLIDNYDSYTYNLAHYLAQVNGQEPVVVYNDECGSNWEALKARVGSFDNIVISPGPGTPTNVRDFGLSRDALEQHDTPVLGICLGHQGLGYLHGGSVVLAPEPRHGRLSGIKHTGAGVFRGLPQDFQVVRYHSLTVEPPRQFRASWPLQETAWTADTGILMGLQHKTWPHYGVQFHPESIGTEGGHQMLANFRDITLERGSTGASHVGQGSGKTRASAPIYIDRGKLRKPVEPPDEQAVARTKGGKGYRVFIRKVDGLGLDAETIFRVLYSSKQTAFWLDSSAKGTCYGDVKAKSYRGGVETSSQDRKGFVALPTVGGRFSFMGDVEGPLARVIEYYAAPPEKLQCLSGNGRWPEEACLRVVGPGDRRETLTGQDLFTYLKTKVSSVREEGLEFTWLGADATDQAPCDPSSLPFEFLGGYVGYLGYELKDDCLRLQRQHHEPLLAASDATSQSPLPNLLRPTAASQRDTPDSVLIFADRLLAFDHEEGALYVIAVSKAGEELEAEKWVRTTEGRLVELDATDLPPTDKEVVHRVDEATWAGSSVSFKPLVSPEQYKARVERSMELIRQGETYEVCLTSKIVSPPASISPFNFYARLRKRNPAPYSAFLRHDIGNRLPSGARSPFSPSIACATRGNTPKEEPAVAVCCSSPERFLRVLRGDRTVESKPIKGTVRRGKTVEEDEELARSLASCEKNRAENLMIVDLVRNDISRVAEPGSVRVPKLMSVESYATVHQLVSTVRGRLQEDKDAIDAIVACFPAGSMTGAPKKRTMEIINKLEQVPRGVYAGALGFISLDGMSADLNVVIRTAVMTPANVTVGAGGAVVALSDIQDEYDEMLLKANAVAGVLSSPPPRPASATLPSTASTSAAPPLTDDSRSVESAKLGSSHKSAHREDQVRARTGSL